jgi:integrase
MKLDTKTIARLALPEGKTDVIHFDDAMPGFGFRIRSSGGALRRSWVVQYRRAGATRRLLLGSADVLGVEQARAAAKKALGKVALGEDPQEQKATRRQRDQHTLKALIDDHLAWKETSGRVRPRTLIQIRRYLTDARYFGPLRSMPVDAIQRRDVAARILTIARDSGAVTASRARSVLSSTFSWAMQCGLCEVNPVVGTLAPDEGVKPRERVLSDDELARVWRAAADDDFGRIVRLLVLTGQRRTEIGGMTWSEINLDRGLWTIPSSRTKNAREHTVPLPSLALSIIETVPRIVGREYLFGPRADGFTSWGRPKRLLDARLGDNVKQWTLHDLRRSFATRMCDLGVAPHVVEQILNHQSGHRRGPAGVYNRSPYEREVRAAMALWGDHIRTLVEGGERKILNFAHNAADSA